MNLSKNIKKMNYNNIDKKFDMYYFSILFVSSINSFNCKEY